MPKRATSSTSTFTMSKSSSIEISTFVVLLTLLFWTTQLALDNLQLDLIDAVECYALSSSTTQNHGHEHTATDQASAIPILKEYHHCHETQKTQKNLSDPEHNTSVDRTCHNPRADSHTLSQHVHTSPQHPDLALSTAQHSRFATFMRFIFSVIVLAAFCVKSRLLQNNPTNLSFVCVVVCVYFALQNMTMSYADYMQLGWWSSCAVLTSQDNAVKCFGQNGDGQLGQGDTNNRGDEPYEMGKNLRVIDFGTDFRVRFLSPAAHLHRCVISDTNQTKCFGFNNAGQLGYGDTTNRGDTNNSIGDFLLPVDLGDDFVPMKIGCGWGQTCSLSTAHTVKCWGSGVKGRLGYGDTMNRGDNAGEMGNNLNTVDLGDTFIPVDIAVGAYQSCVISAAGKAKCWGKNDWGTLGYGDTNHRGDGPNEMGNNLTELDLGTDFFVAQICGGADHTCALSSVGAVKCFGRNNFGQLGLEIATNELIGDAAGEMGDALAAVDLGADFVAIQIACGRWHNCALSSNRSIKCWGKNQMGELGYGDTLERGAATNTMGSFLPEVDLGTDFIPKEVKCGNYDTCSTSENNQMKCWGQGDSGQLGYENNTNRGDLPNQMGDNLPIIDLLDYTLDPTTDPTMPTAGPTTEPSAAPTAATPAPTDSPSLSPSTSPTMSTAGPSVSPTVSPTTPTPGPTISPSISPSAPPTMSTGAPTSTPSTREPTESPTISVESRQTYTIIAVSKDLNETQILVVVLKSLNLTADSIKGTTSTDGNVVILVALPADRGLQSDVVVRLVEEGMVEEYPNAEVAITVINHDETEQTTETEDSTLIAVVIAIVVTVCVLGAVAVAAFCIIKLKKSSITKDETDANGDTNQNQNENQKPAVPPGTELARVVSASNEVNEMDIVAAVDATHGSVEEKENDQDVVDIVNATAGNSNESEEPGQMMVVEGEQHEGNQYGHQEQSKQTAAGQMTENATAGYVPDEFVVIGDDEEANNDYQTRR